MDMLEILLGNLPSFGGVILFIFSIKYYMEIKSIVVGFIKFISWFFKGRKKENKRDYNKKWTNDEMIEDINSREIFTILDKLRNKSLLMTFGDKNRDDIFKKMINIQLSVLEKSVTKMLKSPNIDNLSNNEFNRLTHNTINDYISDTHKELKYEFGKKLYNLVILNPEKGFVVSTKLIIGSMWNGLDDICNSNIIYNHQKIVSILIIIQTSMIHITGVVEKQFQKFNGELTKIVEDEKWS